MIIDERMVTYINSLDTGHTRFWKIWSGRPNRQKCRSFAVKCRAFKSILKDETAKENPGGRNCRRILCCFHGTVRRTGCRDYHNRKLRKRIPIARENFEKSGFADRITLIPETLQKS